MAPKLESLHRRIQRLDAILADAHLAIVGNTDPNPATRIPAIDHDPLLHEGPTQVDDADMTFCPNCHAITLIRRIRENLKVMNAAQGTVVAQDAVLRVEGDDA